MFKRTLYRYMFEFLAKEHKTIEDWDDYGKYILELSVIGGLMSLGISKLIDETVEQYEDYKKSIATQQKEIIESTNE